MRFQKIHSPVSEKIPSQTVKGKEEKAKRGKRCHSLPIMEASRADLRPPIIISMDMAAEATNSITLAPPNSYSSAGSNTFLVFMHVYFKLLNFLFLLFYWRLQKFRGLFGIS